MAQPELRPIPMIVNALLAVIPTNQTAAETGDSASRSSIMPPSDIGGTCVSSHKVNPDPCAIQQPGGVALTR